MKTSSLNIDIQNITKYLEDNADDQTYKLNVEPIESQMTIDLHVFYTTEKELYTSADLQQLSKKTEKLKGSLEQLKTCSNIIYYINADDLLGLDLVRTEENRPIYIKLISEQPRIKKSIHRSSTTGSTKRPETSHSPGRRKSSGRESSTRPEKNQCTQESNLIVKPVKLYNTDILIEYVKSSRKYSIFILTLENEVISCRGTYDERIKSSDVINLKAINKKYDKYDITIYAASTTSLSFPIYTIMASDNFECTVEKFLHIFESLT